ncbi:hypothetical protein B0H13DRAFT_2358168 [Mycena leptocephala]|nr:hypothetical protein B0H13DRAFT_2358168 [Mycena leptocephala]
MLCIRGDSFPSLRHGRGSLASSPSPFFWNRLLLADFTPTSSTAAYSDVRIGDHPLHEASRVDIQLGVVRLRFNFRPGYFAIGIRRAMRAGLDLPPGLHASLTERLPVVPHRPGEPTYRVSDLRRLPPRSAVALAWGTTKGKERVQVVARPASLRTPPGLRSPSAAADRSPFKNGSIVGRLGLACIRSARAEVFRAASCTLGVASPAKSKP